MRCLRIHSADVRGEKREGRVYDRSAAAGYPAFNFLALKDHKNFAAPYNLTPVVRKEILDKNPKIADALNAVAAKLNGDTMAKLNAGVDVDKKTVEDVAEGFLKANGLI